MKFLFPGLVLGLLLVGCEQRPAVVTKLDANSSGTVTQAKTLKLLTDEEAKRIVAAAGGVPDLKELEPTEAEIAETKAKAEAGDADAQFSLGNAYAYGRGVEQDLEEAMKWYRKAAEQGNADAQNKLGWLYNGGVPMTFEQKVEYGSLFLDQIIKGDKKPLKLPARTTVAKGISRDDKEAAKWYRKAAEQGDPPAQCSLGVMYYNGEGVEKDVVNAYAWHEIAGSGEMMRGWLVAEEVKEGKAKLVKQMTPDQIAKAKALVKEMVAKNPKLLNK